MAKPPLPAQCFQLSREVVKALSVEEVDASYSDMETMDLARPPYTDFDLVIPADAVFRVGARRKGPGLYVQPKYVGSADGREVNVMSSISRESAAELEDIDDEVAAAEMRLSQVCFAYRGVKGVQHMDIKIQVKWSDRSSTRLHRLPNALMADVPIAEFILALTAYAKQAYKGLVVLLAAKGVAKDRVRDPVACSGIARDKRYKYTTTLTIGALQPHCDGDNPGEPSGIKRRPHLRRGHIRRQRHGPGLQLVRSIWIAPMMINEDEQVIATRTAYNVRSQA